MKSKRLFVLALSFSLVLLSVITVNAHVPRYEKGNTSPEKSTHISNPTESWVVYGEISEMDEVRYYSINLKEEEKFRVILFTPKTGEFSPSLILMGINLNDNGDVPHEIELPENFGTMVFEGNKKALKEYELSTPSSY